MSTLRRQDPQRRRSASVPPHSSPSRDASTKPKRIHHHHLHRYGPRLLRFLVNPHYSLLLIVAVLSLYVAFPVLADSPLAAFLPPTNPIAPLLFLSYKLDSSPLPFVRAGAPGQYEKGRLDVAFVAFYVVVLSWGRVVLMQGPLRRLAGTCGVRKGGKTGRFIEQSYSAVYWGTMSLCGLKVMSEQKSWWYQTEHFWTDYPMTTLAGNLKAYYLIQLAFWLQETFVLLAGLEKPRADNTQMTIHHIITIWLVIESYFGNLEQIGIAVFFTMDMSDTVLSVSKCISYAGLDTIGNCSFLVFIGAWGYLRHYQYIRMLISVWTQRWMSEWLRLVIFIPMFLLQIVICFWSYRILRVLSKLAQGSRAADSREKGETDTESEETDEEGDAARGRDKTVAKTPAKGAKGRPNRSGGGAKVD